MAKCKKSPVVILCLFLYLLNLSRAAGEEPKELRCCVGWSDDESTIKVVKVMTMECDSIHVCSAGSKTDCAFNYGFKIPSKGAKREDCSNLSDKERGCGCTEDWCNCPAAFRGKEPEPGVQGLKCCQGDSNSKVTEVDCPNSNKPNYPQECTLSYFLPSQGNYFEMGCDAGGNRPSPDCQSYSPNPDKYGGNDGGCRCKTNLCNCRENPPPVNSTTTMKSPKTTPNSTATTPFSTTTMKNLVGFLGFVYVNLFFLPLWSSSYQKHL